jgi:hypothetical protein
VTLPLGQLFIRVSEYLGQVERSTHACYAWPDVGTAHADYSQNCAAHLILFLYTSFFKRVIAAS